MKSTAVVLLAGLALSMVAQSRGMQRWDALSQIESGNNDRAVGRFGEVSRFQIAPNVWRRYAPTNSNWEDPKDALAVAKRIMEERCSSFEATFHRAPTDFEFYILWNAPAQVSHPKAAVVERARRYCNLVQREEPEVTSPKPAPEPPAAKGAGASESTTN